MAHSARPPQQVLTSRGPYGRRDCQQCDSRARASGHDDNVGVLCPASRVATEHSDDEVARSRRRQPTSEHDVRTAVSSSSPSSASSAHHSEVATHCTLPTARGMTAPSAAAQSGGALDAPTTTKLTLRGPYRRRGYQRCDSRARASGHDGNVGRSAQRAVWQRTTATMRSRGHDVASRRASMMCGRQCPAAARRRRQVRTTAKWQRTARCRLHEG